MKDRGRRTDNRCDAPEGHSVIDRPARRSLIAPALVFGALLVVTSLLVAVDAFVTDDGLEYLAHSDDLFGLGLVQLGYRQVGYPIFLWVMRTLAAVLAVDGLWLVAVVQRLVLVGAATYAVLSLRWFAVPIIGLAFTPTALAYTDLILTEGLGLGLAIALGCTIVLAARRLHHGDVDPVMVGLLAGVAALTCAMVIVRFHLLVLLPALALLLVAAHRRAAVPSRARVVAVGIAAGVALAAFLTGAAIENASEYGVASPSVRGEGPAYWTTWRIVFTLTDPGLATELPDLYAEGREYSLIVDTRRLDPDEERETLADARSRLLAASSLSIWEHRARATVGAFRGGRLDDVAGATDKITEGAVLPFGTWFTVATAMSVLLPAAALALLACLRWRAARLIAWCGLVPLVALVAGTGWLLIDNLRFLIVPAFTIVTIACGAAEAAWRNHTARRDSADGGRDGALAVG